MFGGQFRLIQHLLSCPDGRGGVPQGHQIAFATDQRRLAPGMPGGEAGKVLVSRKALQELIKQACLLDDWVEAARPVVRVRGDKVSALVELRLASPEHLKDVCERVQQRITALLQKSLSFEQIGDIQIVVKSFATQPEPRKPEETAILLDRTKPLSRPVAPADAPRVASQPPAASTEAIAPVETAEPKPETADASPSERIPPPPADPER